MSHKRVYPEPTSSGNYPEDHKTPNEPRYRPTTRKSYGKLPAEHRRIPIQTPKS